MWFAASLSSSLFEAEPGSFSAASSTNTALLSVS